MITWDQVALNVRVKSPAGEGLIGGRYVDKNGEQYVIVSVMNRRNPMLSDTARKGMWRLYFLKPDELDLA